MEPSQRPLLAIESFSAPEAAHWRNSFCSARLECLPNLTQAGRRGRQQGLDEGHDQPACRRLAVITPLEGETVGQGHIPGGEFSRIQLRFAAGEGTGVALLPNWVAGPDVREGKLAQLPLDGEPWNTRPSGIYLLRALPEPSAKLRAFTDALRTAIGSPPVWTP